MRKHYGRKARIHYHRNSERILRAWRRDEPQSFRHMLMFHLAENGASYTRRNIISDMLKRLEPEYP